LIRPEFFYPSSSSFYVLDCTDRVAGDYTLVFMIASSTASFNIDVYFMLAAVNDMKQFYKWSVPFRLVTVTAFFIAVLSGLAPTRFLGVPLWEFSGAVATRLALRSVSK